MKVWSHIERRLDVRYARRSDLRKVQQRVRELREEVERLSSLVADQAARVPADAVVDDTDPHGVVSDGERLRDLEAEVDLLRHEVSVVVRHRESQRGPSS